MFRPKPLHKQTVVITGATTPLGRALVSLLIPEGARIVLASADKEELQNLIDEVEKKTEHVLAIMSDVSKGQDVSNIKEASLAVFHSIDTWVNAEGTMVFEHVLNSHLKEEKKIFDRNFWGMRYGSQVAVESMTSEGGMIINIGHVLGAQVQPLLGMFKAAKLATKGFTDALRAEIRDQKLPIIVTFIRPTHDSLETARAIVKCMERPRNEVVVGGAVKLTTIIETFFPKMNDLLMENKMKESREELDPQDLESLGVIKTFKNSLKDNKRIFYAKEQ